MDATKNFITSAAGKLIALCQFCRHPSRPVLEDAQGEPELAGLAHGWSVAYFQINHRHADGAIGSRYTCPACNRNGVSGLAFKRTTVGIAGLPG